ncbi:hypothetical protein [Cellulosimicrobium protaetiae]|uniref:hypothetical protein n=1 Tax=Cellulosimicrobium protaetiae TaxID=2587808 RepID=UPI001C114460|nr:hypothetical protein [Cellulosimicrobium protaetiae]
MTHQTHEFDDLRAEFDATVGRTVYATMVTVDAQNRPRTRALIPVWEVVDGAPLGWLATYRTPRKAAPAPHRNGEPGAVGYPMGEGVQVADSSHPGSRAVGVSMCVPDSSMFGWNG